MSAAALSFIPPQPIVSQPHRQTWVPIEKIVAATNYHPQYIQRLGREGKIVSKTVDQRARNGKPVRLYLAESLPAEFQHKLTPKPKVTLELAPTSPHSGIMPLFEKLPSAPGSGQRIQLDEKAERQAGERYAAIHPLLEWRVAANRPRYTQLRLRDGRAVTTLELLAEYQVETTTVEGETLSVRTLRRWVSQFQQGGLPALARKVRADRGTSRFFEQYPEAKALVASVWLKPAATYTRAHEAIHRDHAKLGIGENEIPSYETVRSFCDTIARPIAVLARQGLRQYNERFAPHLTRGYEDMQPGEVYVADTQTHDVEVRNDCFPHFPQDAPLRLQLVGVMCMRSRKFVGFSWCVNGDWRAIATAFRHAIENHGIPRVAYIDNGADFGKVAAGAKRVGKPLADEMLEGLKQRGPLARLEIEVSKCLPYNAQSKNIERAFRTVHGRLDALWSGYLTGTPFTRPDAATIIGIEHRKLLRMGLGKASMLPPASAFIQIAREFIENDYNERPHTGKGMNGLSPNQVFASRPAQEVRKADPAVLDMLLFERETRLVRAAAITLTVAGDSRRYLPAMSDSDGWARMHELGERKVTIAYDALDPERVVVLDDRDCKVCELVRETLVTQSSQIAPERIAATNEQIGQTLQMRRRLHSATANTVKQIDRAVSLLGAKTELQHLAERAFVSSAVNDLISQKAIKPSARPSQTPQAGPSAFDIIDNIFGDLQ